MTNTLGPAALALLQRAPMPADVVSALADDYLGAMCANPSLRSEERAARHHPKMQSGLAEALCAYPFSPSEAERILTRDRRKGVQACVVRHAPNETLVALTRFDRADVRAAAILRLADGLYDDVDAAALTDHLDSLTPGLTAFVLVAASPEVFSDAEVAAALRRIDIVGRPAGECDIVEWETAKLFAFRPQLATLFTETGFPMCTFSAAAFSPWLTSDAVTRLRADVASTSNRRVAAWVDGALSMNPWAPSGSIPPLVSGPPETMGLDAFAVAWAELVRAKVTRPAQAVPVLAALAGCQSRNAPTRSRVEEVERLLIACCAGAADLPQWMFDRAVAGLSGEFASVGRSVSAYRTDLHREAEPDVLSSDWFAQLAPTASQLHQSNGDFYQPLFDWFAELLGDDLDVWRAALALIDQFDGPLAELAELAEATVSGSV